MSEQDELRIKSILVALKAAKGPLAKLSISAVTRIPVHDLAKVLKIAKERGLVAEEPTRHVTSGFVKGAKTTAAGFSAAKRYLVKQAELTLKLAGVRSCS